MNKQQKVFTITTSIFGGFVILSYILGIDNPQTADVMWGGVPENVRDIYTISMLISASSYFVFWLYTILNILGKKIELPEKILLWIVYLLFYLILIPSALWIPLVNIMISNPSNLIWFGIRLVLILVAVGTLGLLILFLRLKSKPKKIFYYLSIFGLLFFLFHTGVLDAIIWPSLFPS